MTPNSISSENLPHFLWSKCEKLFLFREKTNYVNIDLVKRRKKKTKENKASFIKCC